MVIGIEDGSNEPVGVSEQRDKSDVVKGMQSYLPRRLLELIDIHDFRFEDSEYPKLIGKVFQVLLVEDSSEDLPFLALRNGDGIRANATYVRRGPSTEEASDEELQRILNRRIETGHSSRSELDLEAQLGQLKVLFGHISRGIPVPGKLLATMNSLVQGMGLDQWEYKQNPQFPSEDFDAFIVRMIALKKRRIELELDVVGFIEDPQGAKTDGG